MITEGEKKTATIIKAEDDQNMDEGFHGRSGEGSYLSHVVKEAAAGLANRPNAGSEESMMQPRLWAFSAA